MAIEIVDLPNLKIVIFHSFLYVYQRVGFIKKTMELTTLGIMNPSLWGWCSNYEDDVYQRVSMKWPLKYPYDIPLNHHVPSFSNHFPIFVALLVPCFEHSEAWASTRIACPQRCWRPPSIDCLWSVPASSRWTPSKQPKWGAVSSHKNFLAILLKIELIMKQISTHIHIYIYTYITPKNTKKRYQK